MNIRDFFAATALAVTAALPQAAMADDHMLGTLRIEHPWARASAGHAKAGAAYLMITNRGATLDRLVAIATTRAAKAQLHTHLMENNVMKMRPLAAIEVNPGEPTVMRPGGLHIMLMGLTAPLKVGETFPLTLTFEKAGSVHVNVKVMKIGAMGPGAHKHDEHHSMPGHGDSMPGNHGHDHGS